MNCLRDSSPGMGIQLASEIGHTGNDGVNALLCFLAEEGENHIVRNHAFDALQALGKVSLDPVLSYLHEFDRFSEATQVQIVKGLVRLVGSIAPAEASQALNLLIKRLVAVQESGINRRSWHFIQQIKMEIHAVLASLGCRSALDDLIALLGSGEEPVFPMVIQSVGLIGDRRALIPLIRLHALEGGETWLCTEIRKAFRKIIRRENVDEAELRNLSGFTPPQLASLDQLLQLRKRNGRA
jgi:hypothetical protein